MKQRFASVIGLRPEKVGEYKELHTNIWPEVAALTKAFHILNYSIYLREFPDGKLYLFSSLEYDGVDFEADMTEMETNPTVQEWQQRCAACQIPLTDDGWAPLEEVFHID